jgi:hypothetical protein
MYCISFLFCFSNRDVLVADLFYEKGMKNLLTLRNEIYYLNSETYIQYRLYCKEAKNYLII